MFLTFEDVYQTQTFPRVEFPWWKASFPLSLESSIWEQIWWAITSNYQQNLILISFSLAYIFRHFSWNSWKILWIKIFWEMFSCNLILFYEFQVHRIHKRLRSKFNLKLIKLKIKKFINSSSTSIFSPFHSRLTKKKKISFSVYSFEIQWSEKLLWKRCMECCKTRKATKEKEKE